jgi:SAM-dependent methyltransferase
MSDIALEQFAREYARHRAQEGRGYTGETLLALPYIRSGPHRAQWAVRARTFETFMARVLRPSAARLRRALDVLDLGAGNGWLAYRIALEGHHAIAVDIRDDAVDGLGAASPFLARARRMEAIISSFDSVPLPPALADIALFNSSIHYSTDLSGALREAMRLTRPGGQVVILDSPFYAGEADGLAMIAEKRAALAGQPPALTSPPFIEFLTRERLRAAAPELQWKHHRVRYPIGYELRPLVAALAGKRRPSRFDLWVADAP